jgi:hypothetical protein
MNTLPRVLVGAVVIVASGAIVTFMLGRGETASSAPVGAVPKGAFTQGDKIRCFTDRFDRSYMVLYDEPAGGSDIFFQHTVAEAKQLAKELNEEGNRKLRVFLISAVEDEPKR